MAGAMAGQMAGQMAGHHRHRHQDWHRCWYGSPAGVGVGGRTCMPSREKMKAIIKSRTPMLVIWGTALRKVVMMTYKPRHAFISRRTRSTRSIRSIRRKDSLMPLPA